MCFIPCYFQNRTAGTTPPPLPLLCSSFPVPPLRMLYKPGNKTLHCVHHNARGLDDKEKKRKIGTRIECGKEDGRGNKPRRYHVRADVKKDPTRSFPVILLNAFGCLVFFLLSFRSIFSFFIHFPGLRAVSPRHSFITPTSCTIVSDSLHKKKR